MRYTSRSRATKHRDAKPLRGFGGAGAVEIVTNFDGNTFRAVYTVRLAAADYVLHAFQKKVQERTHNAEN